MTRDPDWNLPEHGDSFEREWARHVLGGFAAYGDFWRRHVVPLSFRPWQPDNPFIRPSLPPHLIDLADAGYAVFYHLAHVHAYEQRLVLRKDLRRFPRPTECLYCFFSHAYSAHEALLAACCAVNRVLEEYERPPLFGIEHGYQGRRHPLRLESCAPAVAGCPPLDLAAYQQMQRILSAYRNLLIHHKPIFLQNKWLPQARELDRYSGLTAIGRVVQDPDCIRRDFRPVAETLAEIRGQVEHVAEMIFGIALVHLDALAGTAYPRDQRRLGRDRKLTRAAFTRARER
jgi:hypothetical protein